MCYFNTIKKIKMRQTIILIIFLFVGIFSVNAQCTGKKSPKQESLKQELNTQSRTVKKKSAQLWNVSKKNVNKTGIKVQQSVQKTSRKVKKETPKQWKKTKKTLSKNADLLNKQAKKNSRKLKKKLKKTFK